MSAATTLGLFVGRSYSGYPAPLPNVKWGRCGGRLDNMIHVGMFLEDEEALTRIRGMANKEVAC